MNKMWKTVLCGMTTCLMLISVGCEDKDVKKRLKFTIKELEEHAPMAPALSRLRVATPGSLKTPELIFARIVKHSGRLWVSWIEANPSIDAIKITTTSSQGESSDVLALQPWDLRENAKEAERFVLYNAGWVYDTGSKEQHERDKSIEYDRGTKEWDDLLRAIEQGACNVMLLRDGIVVSNTVKIEPRGFSAEK